MYITSNRCQQCSLLIELQLGRLELAVGYLRAKHINARRRTPSPKQRPFTLKPSTLTPNPKGHNPVERTLEASEILALHPTPLWGCRCASRGIYGNLYSNNQLGISLSIGPSIDDLAVNLGSYLICFRYPLHGLVYAPFGPLHFETQTR